ncbi:hypothetical protein ACIQ7S_09515 [Streptomyces griseoluteus]|uniref:hypothetical protein n=1 Tax=Streptomyces griseoluteus TaxID=29306 RepID=UPI00332E10E5
MADTRAQLRSTTVVLGGMGLLAAALTACSSSDPDKRCVDRDSYTVGKGYHVVSDKNCRSATPVNGDYYYGGKKKGSWVRSGSFTPPRKSSGGSGGSGGDDSHSVHRGGFGGGHGSSGG